MKKSLSYFYEKVKNTKFCANAKSTAQTSSHTKFQLEIFFFFIFFFSSQKLLWLLLTMFVCFDSILYSSIAYYYFFFYKGTV